MASKKAVKRFFFFQAQTFNAPYTTLLPAMCVFFRVRACCRGDKGREGEAFVFMRFETMKE